MKDFIKSFNKERKAWKKNQVVYLVFLEVMPVQQVKKIDKERF
jgi:hypothetical protein